MRLTRALLLLAIWGLAAPASAEITVGKHAKVFKGGEGITVTVAPIQPSSERTALVKISKVEHELDGLVLLYRVEKQDRDQQRYSTIYKGKRWYPLRTLKSWGYKRYHVDLGGGIKSDVYYDEKESAKVKPGYLMEEYRNLVKSGKVAKLQALEGRKLQKLFQRELRELAKYCTDECLFQPTVNLDWSTVTPEVRFYTDLTAACGQALEAICFLCDDWSSEDVKARVNGVTCRFGKTLQVKLDGKQLIFTTLPGADGAQTRVKALIKR